MVVVIQVPVGLSLVALPLSLRLNDWYTIAMSMFILGITLLIIWGIRSIIYIVLMNIKILR